MNFPRTLDITELYTIVLEYIIFTNAFRLVWESMHSGSPCGVMQKHLNASTCPQVCEVH